MPDKCIARSSYSGNPPPDNGRIPLFFESGSVIDLVNTDDPIWWEVSILLILLNRSWYLF